MAKYIDIEATVGRIYGKWGCDPAYFFSDKERGDEARRDSIVLEMLERAERDMVVFDGTMLWHKGSPKKDGDYMCAMAREGGYKCVLFTVVDKEIVGIPAGLQEYFKRSIRAYIEVPAPPVAEKRTRRKAERLEKPDENAGN